MSLTRLEDCTGRESKVDGSCLINFRKETGLSDPYEDWGEPVEGLLLYFPEFVLSSPNSGLTRFLDPTGEKAAKNDANFTKFLRDREEYISETCAEYLADDLEEYLGSRDLLEEEDLPGDAPGE